MAKLYFVNGRIYHDVSDKLSFVNGRIVEGVGGEAPSSSSLLVNPTSEFIREPNLLRPFQKPVGNVKINPDVGIKKALCWYCKGGELYDGNIIDLTGNTNPYISTNHALPYEHWLPHPQGIQNRYGGDYNLAEALWTDSSEYNMAAWGDATSDRYGNGEVLVFGAVFTLEKIARTGTVYAYVLVGDHSAATAGHLSSGDNNLSYNGDTSIYVDVSAAGHLFTVPNMRDGKPHCAIARMRHESSVDSRVQLFLDGVYIGEQSGVPSGTHSNPHIGMCSSASHHNRVLDGIFHMGWVAENATEEQCLAESGDPYQFLIPA